jgi:hypothetical protein
MERLEPRQFVVPESFRKLYDRCLTGKAGPRAAIKMQCAECVGYDRDEVTNCTDKGCPLFHLRPYSGITRRKLPVNHPFKTAKP